MKDQTSCHMNGAPLCSSLEGNTIIKGLDFIEPLKENIFVNIFSNEPVIETKLREVIEKVNILIGLENGRIAR